MDFCRLVSSIDFIRNIAWALEASEAFKECPEVLHTIEIKKPCEISIVGLLVSPKKVETIPMY